MPKSTHVEIRCYRYICPDCGMSDVELGHLATLDEVHCMVCLIDDDRHVILRRWHMEEMEADAAPRQPKRASAS